MLDLKLIFPKREDVVVAKFLRLKADCLRRAGVIDVTASRILANEAKRLLAAAKKDNSGAGTDDTAKQSPHYD